LACRPLLGSGRVWRRALGRSSWMTLTSQPASGGWCTAGATVRRSCSWSGTPSPWSAPVTGGRPRPRWWSGAGHSWPPPPSGRSLPEPAAMALSRTRTQQSRHVCEVLRPLYGLVLYLLLLLVLASCALGRHPVVQCPPNHGCKLGRVGPAPPSAAPQYATRPPIPLAGWPPHSGHASAGGMIYGDTVDCMPVPSEFAVWGSCAFVPLLTTFLQACCLLSLILAAGQPISQERHYSESEQCN
jgi:hypothetical protein